jgi:hypothetical protein
MELTLSHITDQGFSWLEETYGGIDEKNYKSCIDNYMKEKSDMAKKLLEHWEFKGENTSFFIDFKLKNYNKSEKELHKLHMEIDNYLEDNYTY